jgi:hypothetical protein
MRGLDPRIHPLEQKHLGNNRRMAKKMDVRVKPAADIRAGEALNQRWVAWKNSTQPKLATSAVGPVPSPSILPRRRNGWRS